MFSGSSWHTPCITSLHRSSRPFRLSLSVTVVSREWIRFLGWLALEPLLKRVSSLRMLVVQRQLLGLHLISQIHQTWRLSRQFEVELFICPMNFIWDWAKLHFNKRCLKPATLLLLNFKNALKVFGPGHNWIHAEVINVCSYELDMFLEDFLPLTCGRRSAANPCAWWNCVWCGPDSICRPNWWNARSSCCSINDCLIILFVYLL